MFKSIVSGLVFLLTIAPFSSFGQQTQVYTDPNEVYESGVDLFLKKQYGASNETFERYLRLSPTEPLLVQKARLYMLMNDVKLERNNAHTELADYLRNEPENNTTNLAAFVLASYYFDQQKYKQAARWYDKVNVSNLPKDEWDEAHFKMAYSFFKDDEYDKAKPLFQKISTQDGKYFVEANYYLGYIYYIEKSYESALKYFEKIKGRGPDIMNLYIAQIYYAQKAYKMSLEASVNNQDGKYGKEFTLLVAKSHFQLDEFEPAHEAYKRYGTHTDGLTPDEIWQMAFSYYQTGDYEAAHPIYVKITSEDNALGQLANYQLGECFLKLDMKQNAFYAFGTAKDKDFNKDIKEVAHFNYAKLAFELGQGTVALATTQDFITSYPQSEFIDAAQGMLAEMFLNLKNYTQAVKVLEQIKTYNQQTRSVYQRITYLRGEQLYLDRNFDLSAAYFTKSLKFTPDGLLEAQAHFWLGEIHFQQKEYPEAVKAYNLFLNHTAAPKSRYYHDVYYALGYAYYMQEKNTLALNYFKQYNDKATLVDNQAKYADNALRLGDVYYLLEKLNSSISSYSYVSSRNLPGSDYALFQQAHLHGLMQKHELKIATLKKIESNYSKSTYYDQALFAIAATYFDNLGQSKQAIEYYNKLIKTGKRSVLIADAYLRLALIYYSMEMNDKVLEYCEKTIAEYDRTDAAHQAAQLRIEVLRNTGRTDDMMKLGITRTAKDSLLYDAGLKQFRKGDYAKASKVFDDYINNFPDGFFILHTNYYKAQSLIQLKKEEESLPYLRFVANQPKNEYSDYALRALADYHFNKGQYERALPYYVKLDSITDEREPYIESLMGQVRCQYQLKNHDKVKSVGNRILSTEKISKLYVLETNLLMGKMQLETGNHRTAQFHFDYVSKESPGEMGAEALYLSAVSSYEQNEIEVAREKVFKLDDKFPSYEFWVVKGFILLSDLYVAEGDYFQARATLTTILDAYIDGEQIIIDECKAKLERIDELEKGDQNKQKEEEGGDEEGF